MKLVAGTQLHGDELEQFNRMLSRNYDRVEVLWVDSGENPLAQVKVTTGARTSMLQVPAELIELRDEPAEEQPESEVVSAETANEEV